MNGLVVWFTGLPSAGKSTLARSVRQQLLGEGIPACILDGDTVRDALAPKPGYAADERDAFYLTLARLAALLAGQGLVVLVAATAHLRAYRERARTLAPQFLEVYVATPLEDCERRDKRGLFAQARAGYVTTLPGVNLAYQPPARPDLVAEGGQSTAAAAKLVSMIRTMCPDLRISPSMPRTERHG